MADLAQPCVCRRFSALLRQGPIGPLRRYLPAELELSWRSRATVSTPPVIVWGLAMQAFDQPASDRATT